jgi:hypothetical protein
MYQEVADRYQEKYGGSAKEAQRAVSDGSYAAKLVFRELTSGKAQEIMGRISQKSGEITSSNNVDDLVKNNQVSNSIGDKRDDFARDNDIRTDRDNVAGEISGKGKDIQDQHTKKYEHNEDEYQETEQINSNKQAHRQEEINKYEEDRIGRNGPSSLIGGLGRSPQVKVNDDLDFEPIARPYEPKVGKYNWETGKIEQLLQGAEHESNLKSVRPPEEVRSFDKKEAQNIIEQFKPVTTNNTRGSKAKSRADGQYVDPKRK